MKQLGGVSLETAVAFCLARHPANLQRRTVADVVAEFQEAKTKDGASPAYLRDLKFRLRAFANTFRCAIGAVDEPGLNAWLRSLKCSARTRNNYRGVGTALIRFAEAQAYLPTGAVDLRKVAKGREVANTVEIFTPSEMVKLIAAAQVDRHELEPGWNRRWAVRQGLLPLLTCPGSPSRWGIRRE